MIKTERLILRLWEKGDMEPFAEMNADPRVMEYFPSAKTFDESREECQRIIDGFEQYGWGFWAVSVIGGPRFIGFVGLKHVNFDAHFTPAIEIGWRLLFQEWGKGYATEGALASLIFGFEVLKAREIVSFTSAQNRRSMAVMEKIGMHRNPTDDFDHPKIAADHPLRRCVLYRLKAPVL